RDDPRWLDRDRLVGRADRVERRERAQAKPPCAVARGDVGKEAVLRELDAEGVSVEDHSTSTRASACWPNRTPATATSAATRARRSRRGPAVTSNRTSPDCASAAEPGSAVQPFGRTSETSAGA